MSFRMGERWIGVKVEVAYETRNRIERSIA